MVLAVGINPKSFLVQFGTEPFYTLAEYAINHILLPRGKAADSLIPMEKSELSISQVGNWPELSFCQCALLKCSFWSSIFIA